MDMPFIIRPPAPASPQHDSSASSSDDESLDSEGDTTMLESSRPTKRARLSSTSVITPGELITDDPQWMRYFFTFSPFPTPKRIPFQL